MGNNSSLAQTRTSSMQASKKASVASLSAEMCVLPRIPEEAPPPPPSPHTCKSAGDELRDWWTDGGGGGQPAVVRYDLHLESVEPAAVRESVLPVKREELLLTLDGRSRSGWVEAVNGSLRVGWVPSDYVKPVRFHHSTDHRSTSVWYHGRVGREEAEGRLWASGGGVSGCFLLRDSETSSGHHTLSLLHADNVYHYRVLRTEPPDSPGPAYSLHPPPHKSFPSVEQLVQYHSDWADGLVSRLLFACPPHPDQPLICVSHSLRSALTAAAAAAAQYNATSASSTPP